MSKNTRIEWCDSTFNPWLGCSKVSPACDDCYAARSTPARTLGVVWGPGQDRRRTTAENWKQPTRWNAKPFYECEGCGWRREDDSESSRLRICQSCGTRLTSARRRVFCASLGDVFDNAVPPEWRQDLFELIRLTPNLDWLLLTKRPQNIVRMVQQSGAIAGNGTHYLPSNVWLGTTVEDNKRAQMNIPALLRTIPMLGARTLFLSVEPMLDRVDVFSEFTGELLHTSGDDYQPGWINWVICGGESGPNARPMSPDWARHLRDQCAKAHVPFTFKQWGEWIPMLGQAEGIAMRPDKVTTPDGWVMGWAGKKAAGRRLDGVEHTAFPQQEIA